MKKVGYVLLSILLILPMFVGICFLTPSSSPVTMNKGEGIKSNQDIADNIEEQEENTTTENYTFVDYNDYMAELLANGATFSFKGEGTKENPYQISTRDELVYLCYQVYNVDYFQYDKYWLVTNDIELNDETFHKDGTITGGDGVVYLWRGIGRWTDNYNKLFCGKFDGGNKIISGVYFKSETSTSGKGFFGFTRHCDIKNIKLNNLYISITKNTIGASLCGGLVGFVDYTGSGSSTIENCEVNGFVSATGDHTGGLIGNAYTNQTGKIVIKNCRVNADVFGGEGYVAGIFAGYTVGELEIIDTHFSGNVTGTKLYVGGITSYISSSTRKVTIKDCTAKGEINGKQYTSGFVSFMSNGVDCRILNSKNYATINASNIESAGFVARCYGGVLIENCINYGNLNAGNYGAGGMVGWNQGNKLPLKIRNCANFGDIVSSKSVSVGPIVGVTEGFLDVDGFESGGIIQAQYNNSLVGEMSTRYTQETYIRVNRIVQKSKYVYSILGSQTMQNAENKKITIIMTNCEINGESKSYHYLIRATTGKAEVFAKNIKIKDVGTSARWLVCSVGNTSKMHFENVYVESNKTQFSTTKNPVYEVKSVNSEVTAEGIIFNNIDKKLCYGNDFSGFYYDYKNGLIGLKAFSGKGFYHTAVSFSSLVERGYQKREI